MLTNKMRMFLKWLKRPDKTRRYNKSLNLSRVEMYSLMTLKEDLPLIIKSLPEERLSKIFTAENLMPLVHILVGWDLKLQERTIRHYQIARLFAESSLSIWEAKVSKSNPASNLIRRAFNDVLTLILDALTFEKSR